MDQTLALSLIIIAGFAFLAFLIRQKNQSPKDDSLTNWLKSLQQSFDTKTQLLNDSLQNQSKTIHEALMSQTSKNTEQLLTAQRAIYTKLQETSKVVGEMSEIGRSMRDLQEFLKSPKLRGNIGEEVLQDLIGQTFPKNSFNLQYTFKNGAKVDVALKTDAGILPIDAKFPMENFLATQKAENDKEKQNFKKEFITDVKKHIDAIAKKYILPDEGTMDFALMYVPSDSVFYEICSITQLSEYARTQRVYIVSPTTLYAHLQMILLSFEGKKIESKSRQVFSLLRSLQHDYSRVEGGLLVLNKHLNNATGQMSNVMTGFTQMGNKLNSAQSLHEEQNELTDTEPKELPLTDSISI